MVWYIPPTRVRDGLGLPSRGISQWLRACRSKSTFSNIAIVLQEQIRRQEQVVKVCEKYSEIKSLSPKNNTSMQGFSYIAMYNLLLCRINKCGSSSWVFATFQQLAPSLGISNYQNENFRDKLKHFEIESVDALSKIITGKPFSIVNVRHPFERLVSGKDC